MENQAEVHTALSGDNAHDAGQDGQNTAGNQNGHDHAVEGQANADGATGLHAGNNEHVTQRNNQCGHKGLASSHRNCGFAVFVSRSGFYSNSFFLIH